MNFDSLNRDERKSMELKKLHAQFAQDDYLQNQQDLKALLKIPAFRRFFVSVIKKAHVFGSIMTDESQTNSVMKNLGFRELGVDIYMTANQADGEMVLKAIQERTEVERERKARIDLVYDEMKGNK